MKKLMSKYLWVIIAPVLLAGCGEGADDVSIDYNEDTVISENASNVYEAPPRAPDGFKVIYYVDAGDGTPGKLEILETFGTRSSVEDQAYKPDLVTGYSWGYTSETAQYYADADNYGSIRGDERDTAGEGVEYSFELDNGSYTVVFGFNDPWDSEGTRHVDLVAEGTVLEEGYFIPAENEFKRFDNVEVTDGVLDLAVKRTISNTDGGADPQISWIEIWGDTDEETATPVQKIWISGEFQINGWELSQAPLMTAQTEGWYETTVHFQQAGTFNFIDQNSTWDSDYYGTDGDGNLVYSTDVGSVSVDDAGYYTVRFNLDSLEYSVEVTDLSGITTLEQMYIIGKGFPEYPDLDWWSEESNYGITDSIPMVKNYNGMGEHVFGIEGLEFADVIELEFISSQDWDTASEWGFTNLGELNENIAEFYWHETVNESYNYLEYTAAAGLYTVIFDYAVGRATLIKQSTDMFMVGTGTGGDWNASQAGIMSTTEDWPGWYYIDVRFTAEDSGDAVKPYGDFKFISEQSWDKDNFGLVDASVSLTEMENSGNSHGIPAPAPGYYNVWFQPETLEYEWYETDLAAQPVLTEMYIVGKGYVDYPELDWSAENSIPMVADFQGQGDYVFGLECLELSDAVDMKFLGQLAWEGFDAGFVNGGEQTAPIVWVKADVGDGTADLKLIDQAGFYDISFDYLINRISVTQNETGTCQ